MIPSAIDNNDILISSTSQFLLFKQNNFCFSVHLTVWKQNNKITQLGIIKTILHKPRTCINLVGIQFCVTSQWW